MIEALDKRTKEYRDRNVSGLSVDQAHREGIVMGDSRDPNAAVEQERVRVPLTSGQKLSLRGYKLDWANFHYHWVHDDPGRPGRVQAYKAAFYEHCLHEDGSVICTPSGAGMDYLMRLPSKYHQEDVRASRDRRLAARRRESVLKDGEYTVDRQGRAVDEGEVVVRRSVSENPYA